MIHKRTLCLEQEVSTDLNSGNTPEGQKRSSTQENNDEPPKSLRLFELENSEDTEWNLPEDIVKYVHKHSVHVHEKDLKDKILSVHSVPQNMKGV